MSEEPMRHCYACKNYLPASAFCADSSRLCKVQSKCRDCARTALKARKKLKRRNQRLVALGYPPMR